MSNFFIFFESLEQGEFKKIIQDKKQLVTVTKKLGLDGESSLNDLVEFLIVKSRELIDSGERSNAILIMKRVKEILPLVDKKYYVSFYLALAHSFITNNEYQGAEEAAKKAKKMAYYLKDPKLIVKTLNLHFLIYRTIGKDKALQYLKKSKAISKRHNLYENIIYTEVNIGLMHLFNKKITEAANSCTKVMTILEDYDYPTDRLLMPSDFFLHLFNENRGLVKVEKYRNTILTGIDIVLKASNNIKNVNEKARRLSILTSFLKMSPELFDSTLEKIISFIEQQNRTEISFLLASIANGIGEYKNYKISLSLFQRALNHIEKANDEIKKRIRKNYAYTLAKALNVKMVYDLASSSSDILQLENIRIKTEDATLLGKGNIFHKYRSTIVDSDSIFGIPRKIITDQILPSIKEQYRHIKSIIDFSHERKRDSILQDIEIFSINAINQDNDLISLLLSGSTIDENFLKIKKKIYSGYQIIGQIVPPAVIKQKHFEEFPISFIYDLIYAPQKFKQIELVTVSDTIDTSFEKIK